MKKTDKQKEKEVGQTKRKKNRQINKYLLSDNKINISCQINKYLLSSFYEENSLLSKFKI